MKRRITLLVLSALLLFMSLPVLAADCPQNVTVYKANSITELIKQALSGNKGVYEQLQKYIEAYLGSLPSYSQDNAQKPSPLPSSSPTALPTPTPSPSGNDKLAAYEEEVIRLVNEERKKAGLNGLITEKNITNAARARAAEISRYFSHTRPDGSSCFTVLKEYDVSYRGAGENIASGHTSAKLVMDGWMNSSGHRANILNPSFKKIGVGCYKDSAGRLNWTQLFIY